jgi:hypothetical protein
MNSDHKHVKKLYSNECTFSKRPIDANEPPENPLKNTHGAVAKHLSPKSNIG